MELTDGIWLWLFTLGMAGIGGICRIAVLLYGRNAPLPPPEPGLLVYWRMRRRWLVTGELMALPAIAAFAMLAYEKYAPAIALGLGVSGSLVFLEGMQARIRRFFGVPDHD